MAQGREADPRTAGEQPAGKVARLGDCSWPAAAELSWPSLHRQALPSISRTGNVGSQARLSSLAALADSSLERLARRTRRDRRGSGSAGRNIGPGADPQVRCEVKRCR
jgi:hypothetical protein